MQKKINIILEELYVIDPSLKDKEGEIIRIIEKLLSSRPDAKMDPEFKAELREQLLKELQQGRGRQKKFSPGRIIGFSGAAAAVVVIVFAISLAVTGNIRKQALTRSNRGVETTTTETADVDLAKAEESPPRSVTRAELDERNSAVAAATETGEGVLRSSEGRESDKIKSTGIQPAALEKDVPGYMGTELLPDARFDNTYPKNNDVSGTVMITGNDGSGIISQPEETMQSTAFNTEEFDRIYENRFLDVISNPLSTFSIDVDTASYANVRRYIRTLMLPPADAVRIEELVNYFTYDYPDPAGDHPFSFTTEISACPWDRTHKLLHIGIQGRRVDTGQMPPANLVFLVDVSGSMDDTAKLPLLKKAFQLLVNNLREQDRVAIVVYAGAAGLVLDSTPGSDRQRIMDALEQLSAGGSTAGGEGIKLAYKVAADNFTAGGNNRIILATDGDFNVGPSSDAELVRLIEEKRKTGVFLTVLGFGMGNYKDSKMEQLADKGNGNYAYIDNIMEAKKVLVSEMGSTLLTIARDVKIQVEFNPAHVQSYRLIGYENRALAAEDFVDDTKDAGELGAGHSVTALYELVPATGQAGSSDLKYQKTTITEEAAASPELLTLKFRYKKPDEVQSRLVEIGVTDDDLPLSAASTDFRFAAAVAEWGMLLRDSEYKADSSYEQVLELAQGARGYDDMGYREEFIRLVKESAVLKDAGY